MEKEQEAQLRTINNEDWLQIERIFNSSFGYAKLKIDSYELNLNREFSAKSSQVISVVYVNGYFKGIWCQCDPETGEPIHEEGQRFFRKKSKLLYPLNSKNKKFLRNLSKIDKAEAERFKSKRLFFADPIWPSFKSFKKHLIAKNDRIEVIEIVG